MREASAKLRNDSEIVLAAVKQNGRYLSYASARLKTNKEIVLAAVKQDGSALLYASTQLQNDPEIVLAAVKQDGNALKYASSKLIFDPEIFQIALRKTGIEAFRLMLAQFLFSDPAVLLTCTMAGAYVLSQVPFPIAAMGIELLVRQAEASVVKILKQIPETSSLSRILAASKEESAYLLREELLTSYCLQQLTLPYEERYLEDIAEILKYGNKMTAFWIAADWIEVAKDPVTFDAYKKSMQDSTYLTLPMIMLSSLAKGSKESDIFLTQMVEILQSHRAALKDSRTQLLPSLLDTLLALENTEFSSDQKIHIIRQVCRKESEYSAKELLKALRVLQVICTLKISLETLLTSDLSLESLEKKFISGVNRIFAFKESIEDFTSKYLARFSDVRVPYALEVYAGKVEDGDVKSKLAELVESLLQGTFKEKRYSTHNNPHLAQIANKHAATFTKWKESSQLAPITLNPSITPKKVAIIEVLKEKWVTDRHLQYLKDGEEKCAVLIQFLKHKDKYQKKIRERFLREVEALKENETQEVQRLSIEVCNPDLSDEKKKGLLAELIAKMEEMPSFKDSQALRDVQDLAFQVANPLAFGALTAQITDDWQDLFLCGTEVLGSCQSINSPFDTNKCLLAYVMDGKNLLLAVKDPSGKIVARSIVRLLLDEKEELVLFQERLYPSPCPENQTKALNQLASNLATHLGVSLMTINTDRPVEVAAHTLRSLGSSCPFEYSDASGAANNYGVTDGRFVIPNAKKVL